MENSLSHVIFYWFFATTAHQRIIFMFLIETKFCESFRYFLALFMEKIPKNPLSELCEKENNTGMTLSWNRCDGRCMQTGDGHSF